MSHNDAASFTPENKASITLARGDICIAASYSVGEVDIRRNSGSGRVLVLDKDLTLKGALWTGEEGLVIGLGYCPGEKCLYVSDVGSQTVKRFDLDGHMLPSYAAMQGKPFGTIAVGKDGSIVIGEHIKGDKPPFMGGGEIYKFDGAGQMLQHFSADHDPGKFGFHGVTNMRLNNDDRTAVYISETGKRVMQYDLVKGCQLDDLFALPEDSEMTTTGIDMTAQGEILMATAHGAGLFSSAGEMQKEYDIPKERGWSAVRISADGRAFFLGNFFTGRLEKRDLDSGEILAAIDTGLVYRLAAIVEIT